MLPKILLLSLLPFTLGAQSVGAWIDQADRYWAEGRYAEAAEQYERAGRLKSDRPVLLWKAAEAYYRARDYRKAAECYRSVQEEHQKFELAGLRYARALKQDGRYPEAREAFRQSLFRYRGEHHSLLEAVVDREIAGCELALRWQEEAALRPDTVEIHRLPDSVNASGDVFAPLPYGQSALYFSQLDASGSAARLMRSERTNGLWQPPVAAQGLPPEAARGFSSGVFSPDSRRFYCVQCHNQPATRPGESPTAARQHCEIVVLRRSDEGWGRPEPLRGYVNLPEFTALAPAVVHEGGREYLIFASDRAGGQGGLDLYRCERPLAADDLDFSLPLNLGPTVNTGGDETTPFFDTAAQILYFSSNGHVSLGGFDVFRSARQGGQWQAVENLGLPYNSPADDLWFVPKTGERGAFLSSNRFFGAEKPGTRDDDLFEFRPAQQPVFAAGEVIDEAGGGPATAGTVSLLEKNEDGSFRLLQTMPLHEGRFLFRLPPGGGPYAVEAVRTGYQRARVSLGGPNRTAGGYEVSLLMRRE